MNWGGGDGGLGCRCGVFDRAGFRESLVVLLHIIKAWFEVVVAGGEGFRTGVLAFLGGLELLFDRVDRGDRGRGVQDVENRFEPDGGGSAFVFEQVVEGG